MSLRYDTQRSVISDALTLNRGICLELVIVASGYDDIIDFENHAAQLRSEKKLLSFANQGIYNKILSHIFEQY